MDQMADRDRFCCQTNDEWQLRRAMTFFWDQLEGSFRSAGIGGLRREVVGFIKSKCEDSGVHLEFVNYLAHLAESVLEGRRNALLGKGYKLSDADEKARGWPLYRSVVRCWEVAHKMFALRRADKRGWHIKLSKLEKVWG